MQACRPLEKASPSRACPRFVAVGVANGKMKWARQIFGSGKICALQRSGILLTLKPSLESRMSVFGFYSGRSLTGLITCDGQLISLTWVHNSRTTRFIDDRFHSLVPEGASAASLSADVTTPVMANRGDTSTSRPARGCGRQVSFRWGGSNNDLDTKGGDRGRTGALISHHVGILVSASAALVSRPLVCQIRRAPQETRPTPLAWGTSPSGANQRPVRMGRRRDRAETQVE